MKNDQIVPSDRHVGRRMDIARSPHVSHFAPSGSNNSKLAQPKTPVKSASTKSFDIAPRSHPLTRKISPTAALKTKMPESKPVESKPPISAKEAAIAEAFSNLATEHQQTKSRLKRRSKIINWFLLGLVILLIVGYIIYINLPSISVGIAGSQAGIAATYPQYQPDGYSPSGAIKYSSGQVTINFHANTGNQKYSISESKSLWDSNALKDKVNNTSKGEFITTDENGLRIFSYDNTATWVNGGILYTISGNVALSSDQIRSIATSL